MTAILQAVCKIYAYLIQVSLYLYILVLTIERKPLMSLQEGIAEGYLGVFPFSRHLQEFAHSSHSP